MGEDASETYTDRDGTEGVSEVENDILCWFCLTCTSMPKQITELMKRFSEFKKDLRIMKKTLEGIKAKEKTSEPQPEKPTPPEIKLTIVAIVNPGRQIQKKKPIMYF